MEFRCSIILPFVCEVLRPASTKQLASFEKGGIGGRGGSREECHYIPLRFEDNDLRSNYKALLSSSLRNFESSVFTRDYQ